MSVCTAHAVRCTAQLGTTFLADRCPSNVRMGLQASLTTHAAALRAYRTKKESTRPLPKADTFLISHI